MKERGYFISGGFLEALDTQRSIFYTPNMPEEFELLRRMF